MNEPDSLDTMPLRILLVEDVPADAELTIDALRADGIDCEVRCVDTEDDYVAALDGFRPGIVLSDLGLPEFNGYRALQILRRPDALVPVASGSGARGGDGAVAAVRQGAARPDLKGNHA